MQNTINLIFPFSIRFLIILKQKIKLKIFWILGSISIISLLVFYIFQANAIVSEGYQIQTHQKKINELSQENEISAINLAQINSLGNIEIKIKDLGFEKIDKIRYIQVLESQIATK